MLAQTTTAQDKGEHELHPTSLGKEGSPYKLDAHALQLNTQPYMPNQKFVLDYEVLGWLPYWEDKKIHQSLNYSLLTTLAYFSYELQPSTGKYKTIHNWNTTPVIDSALAQGTKVLLTVTNFGDEANKRFLNDPTAISTFITTVKGLLASRKVHGVCIDFEGVASAERNAYTTFVKTLNTELKSGDTPYMIYLAVPKVDWQKFLDLPTLAPLVDQFTIMGYSYHTTHAGPLSPLKSDLVLGDVNIEKTIDYYLASVPPQKVMLGLPFYGNIWETEGESIASKTIKTIGARTFNYIKTHMIGKVGKLHFDTVSKSPYLSYSMNGDNSVFRHCWFENDSSFQLKLNYVKTKNLHGVGIWALGFDVGYHDYWAAIAKSLCNTGKLPVSDTAANDSINNDTIPPKPGPLTPAEVLAQEKKSFEEILTTYKSVIILGLILVIFFGGIGFLIALFQPNSSLVLFAKTANLIYYSLAVLLFVVVLLRVLHVLDNISVGVIVGFILGGFSVYFLNKWITNRKNDLP